MISFVENSGNSSLAEFRFNLTNKVIELESEIQTEFEHQMRSLNSDELLDIVQKFSGVVDVFEALHKDISLWLLTVSAENMTHGLEAFSQQTMNNISIAAS